MATNDLHYTYADDADAHEVLLCVQSGSTMADPKRFKFDARDFYLKSPAEMRALWDAEVPGACDNTLEIAERIGDYSAVFAVAQPDAAVPGAGGRDRGVAGCARRCRAGWRGASRAACRRATRAQAEYELDVICKMGFPGYFLVTADLVRATPSGRASGSGRAAARRPAR